MEKLDMQTTEKWHQKAIPSQNWQKVWKLIQKSVTLQPKVVHKNVFYCIKVVHKNVLLMERDIYKQLQSW
jgi:hypothetical protein